MIPGVIGIVVSMLILLNGFSALRRPVDVLVQHDPLGKRILAKRGQTFTRRLYRVYGVGMVLIGMLCAYLSLGILRN